MDVIEEEALAASLFEAKAAKGAAARPHDPEFNPGRRQQHVDDRQKMRRPDLKHVR